MSQYRRLRVSEREIRRHRRPSAVSSRCTAKPSPATEPTDSLTLVCRVRTAGGVSQQVAVDLIPEVGAGGSAGEEWPQSIRRTGALEQLTVQPDASSSD